jgi:hypothetical protein
LAIAIFVNGAKGHSALQLSRDLDVQYKTEYLQRFVESDINRFSDQRRRKRRFNIQDDGREPPPKHRYIARLGSRC